MKSPLKWYPQDMRVSVRYRAYDRNMELSPYFIDKGLSRAHYTIGKKYGVYGSGMHPSGCAACFGGFNTLKLAQEFVNQKITEVNHANNQPMYKG